jgi:3D (Asp-Asp-Asp) domain-containing protein
MPKEENLIKIAEPRIQKINIKKRRSKKKPEIEFKSIRKFLVPIIILLVILLVLESTQIFFQFKNLTKEATTQRSVYVVDSQPIDLDAYLREYFVNKVPNKTMYVTVTAYSSTKDQTDGNPFLTALGTPVRDGIVAANFLPIGTVVRFPDKFGEKIFVVEDRMHEKYGLQVDIWISNQEEAKKFGIQYLKMEIF